MPIKLMEGVKVRGLGKRGEELHQDRAIYIQRILPHLIL
jgi:hypothetical protein